MSKYIYLIILFITSYISEAAAQSDRFIVKPTSFSSKIYNEFSPVFYKEGIVFCSDLRDNSLLSYNDEENRLFKIFYVTRKGNSGWSLPKILAKEVTTSCNDGPSTFTENGNIMYYTRNNTIENSMRNIADTTNKLGIYSAELIDGKWTNIKPFKYNNPRYSFVTPSLTPDGKRIYFASDMPGGRGRMDIYYCEMNDSSWDKPVNMGPLINTQKNESFPFACKYGKLYFASDGLKGLGRKDLFYTRQINGEWIEPVHLDSAINSSADDFGIVLDSTLENGYFSSNRLKTDDIFSFSAAPVEFTNCDSLKENNYCFTFYDEHQRLTDTVPVVYQWDFGNGILRIGPEVKHCFPGPGHYLVKLSIKDELTGNVIAEQVEYKVNLENFDQAYINSYNVGITDKSISFEGIITDLKGIKITDFFWDFGDGFKPGGLNMSTTFKKKGVYTVRLGLFGEKDTAGIIPKICVMKKINIYDDFEKFALKGGEKDAEIIEKTDSALTLDKTLQIRSYFMDDLSGRQKGKIERVFNKYGNKTLQFDQNGIKPASLKFLDDIINLLKNNTEIKLEIVLYSEKNEMIDGKMLLAEEWARELSSYFKNKGTDMNSFHSKGFVLSDQMINPFIPENKTINGEIEFIFMNK
jgi:PKD repeat protein